MQAKPSKPAHDLLGFILEKLLTPLNITVNNRMRLMAEAPEADVLLLMKGGTMQEYYLSPEKMLEIGRRYEDLLLANLSVEKKLAGLRPEEVLSRFKPEDILDNLSAEDIVAYLKKKRRLGSLKGGLSEGKPDIDS